MSKVFKIMPTGGLYLLMNTPYILALFDVLCCFIIKREFKNIIRTTFLQPSQVICFENFFNAILLILILNGVKCKNKYTSTHF